MNKIIKSCLLLGILVPTTMFASSKTSSYEEEMDKYTQAQAKYESELEAFNQAYEQYQQDLELYQQNVELDKISIAEYEEAMKQYQEAYQKYEEELKYYQQQKKEYEQVLAQMENDKDKPVHLSKPVGQALQFGSDPNATLTITGGTPTSDIAQPREVVTSGGAQAPNVGRRISRGDTVVATYNNLTNAFYCRKPITKMVNTFSLNPILNGQSTMNLFIYNDPTNGFFVENLPTYDHSDNGASALRCQTKFYYADGTEVQFSQQYPAIIGIASLNNNYFPNQEWQERWREEIIDYNFEFVPITGSIVQQHEREINGVNAIYADEYTNINNGSGNAFDKGEYGTWDIPTSSDFWRVSGAGVITAGTEIDYIIYSHGIGVGNEYLGNQWVAYSTDLPNVILPIVPAEPQPPVEPAPPVLLATKMPTPPVEPEAPVQPEVVSEREEVPDTGVKDTIDILLVTIIGATILYIHYRKHNQ